ncbi:MAG: hypothetical protein ACRDHG_09275 [Anaerolineales bacterium]
MSKILLVLAAIAVAVLTAGFLRDPNLNASQQWTYAAAAAGILNTTTAVTIKAAAANERNYVEGCSIQAETLGAATEFAIRDGAAGTVLWRTKLATVALPLTDVRFDPSLRGTVNTLLEVVTLTATVTGAVYVNCQGYVGP